MLTNVRKILDSPVKTVTQGHGIYGRQLVKSNESPYIFTILQNSEKTQKLLLLKIFYPKIVTALISSISLYITVSLCLCGITPLQNRFGKKSVPTPQWPTSSPPLNEFFTYAPLIVQLVLIIQDNQVVEWKRLQILAR